MESAALIEPGYRIHEEIRGGGAYVLYRATRIEGGADVFLKAPAADPPRPIDLAGLLREQQVLSELGGDGVLRCLALEASSLVLEYVEGRPLSRLATADGDTARVERFFRVAIPLVRALGLVHRAGYSHRRLHIDGVLASADASTLWLTDFHAASRLTERDAPGAERSPLDARDILSPEQTGRMNRAVDYRCDFYALGAIFYEVLTGRRPFEAGDALELVHAHLARSPARPSALSGQVPEAASDIVMKLLSKMAEDRYQSADGLIADLERLETRWIGEGVGSSFALGTAEQAHRFSVPQRLYGREREVDALQAALAQATKAGPVFAFVSGDAGTGKTSVVGELRKVVASSGRFSSGKFDQVERGVPYSALLGALTGICDEPGDGAARSALAERVLRDIGGTSAGTLAAVVPAFSKWLGPLPEVPPLGPTLTENRLVAALQSLLVSLARPEEPLVVFLDDLQWADMGTVRLLSSALDGKTSASALFIGAYRDGEVSSADPVPRLRRSLEDRGVPLVDVRLSALRLPDLVQLLRDALRRDDPGVDALAELVRHKTDGNPFFVTRFLESLGEQGLLTWGTRSSSWSFDLTAVSAANMTDNVLELMSKKLGRLNAASIAAVRIAACFGDSFSLGALARVARTTSAQVANDLWEPIQEAVLVPLREDYEAALAGKEAMRAALELRFSHDRVKQAAYAGIDESARAPLHLTIGRALLPVEGDSDADGRLFEAVFHLNRGRSSIEDDETREALSRHNLMAGRRARARGAVTSALEHFRIGLELRSATLHDETWAWLSVEAAECEFIAGEDASAERRLDAVRDAQVKAPVKLEAARVRVVRYENTGKFDAAVRVATTELAALGFSIGASADEREAQLSSELSRIETLLGGRSFESLATLPEMTDPDGKQLARLLVSVWPSAFLRNEKSLTALLSARLVRASLELGVTKESALGFITHAITLNARSESYAGGSSLGRLGLAVSERFGDPALTVPALHLFGSFLAPFAEPLSLSQKRAELSHTSAVGCGDFTHASRAAFLGTWYAFFGGEPLPAFEQRSLTVVAFVHRMRHEIIERAEQILLQWSKALRGLTSGPCSLSDGSVTDAALDAALEKVPIFRGFLAVARGFLAMTFGAPEDARPHVEIARAALQGSAETLWHAMLDFLDGVATIAGRATAAPLDAEAQAKLEAIISRLHRRREAAPSNFAHQYFLLVAERARACGDLARADTSYRAAIAAADDSGSLPARAFCREWHARFEFSRGNEAAAGKSLRAAASFYAAWGARAKVEALDRAHPALAQSVASSSRDFDTESVFRAAHAIAGEIEWDALLPRLVRIVVENAAAERGVLVEARDGELAVVAEGGPSAPYAVISPPAAVKTRQDLPLSVIDAVVGAETAVISADARLDARFKDDPYVRRAEPRALLCVPISRQGKLAFVVYLENSLSADVFTESRVEVIRVLSAQAAISLENARLYQAMKAEIARRAHAEALLEKAVEDLEAMKNRLQAENVYLQEEIRSAHDFEEIVGNSARLLEALDRVERVAATDSTVLIIGETGTGKELFARALHARSPRNGRPLVKVNCGAISTGLVESELFGHVKGAFTGALTRRVGRFELADGGTLFLDEVSELPMDTQTKLLRVLQEREFEAVGSSRTQRTDVRVIAASNKDLEAAVRAGRFRADLLYRLNVFPIVVPPLRERPGDIPLLVAFFLTRIGKKLGKTLQGFSHESMERLLGYAWPGNVRELQNVVERAAVFATGPVLDARFVAAPQETPASHSSPASPAKGGKTLQDLERDHILKALEASGWVIEGARGAAESLGLHPNTLRSRMKKLGIARAR